MRTVLLVPLLAILSCPAGASEPSGLLRFPALGADRVAFVYANDIWVAPRAGGSAQKLTSHPGQEWFPHFSPDGKWLAFTGDYDGNQDVYVMPATGGEPRRLTYSPDISGSVPERFGPDNAVLGWTPDGRIVYRARREQWNVFMGRPWTVRPEGGPPEALALPFSGLLSFSPDGRRVAYNPTWREFRTWKRYRGGMAQDIFILDLTAGSQVRITESDAVDDFPMWDGDTIYFVSEREGRANLYAYGLSDKQTRKLTSFSDFDVKWPSLGPGGIVFELGGALHLYDLAKGTAAAIDIQVPSDRVPVRERIVDVQDRIEEFWLSPDAKRALFVARGELFSVPAEHGTVRNLTRSSGVRERHAMWSPDGKWIAALSDRTGEYEVVLFPQEGRQEPIQLTRGGDCFRFQLVWSPDSKKLAFADKNLALWWLDVGTRKIKPVDRAKRWEIRDYNWSPDSRWLAYAKPGDNGFRSIWLHDTQTAKSSQVTSAMFDDSEPVFDPQGRYLYFLSDRDFNAHMASFESNFFYDRMGRPYALVLQPERSSPFAPRSDEVGTDLDRAKRPGADKDAKADKNPPKIEPLVVAGLEDRLVAFPVVSGNLHGLRAAAESVFWLDGPSGTLTGEPSEKPVLEVFDLVERKLEQVYQPVDNYELAALGERLIYKSEGKYYLVEAKAKQPPGDKIKPLDLSGLRMELDPRAEWRQIFFEAWRQMRDYFYDPHMNAVDWPAVRDRYAALLPQVAHRSDLTYLIGEMIGELGSGHAYVGGGDLETPVRVSIGLLGAQLEPDAASGRWRIARIFEGQNWDPTRRSPLTEPGLDVRDGDYLLQVEGRQLRLPDQPGQLLLDRAGKPTSLRINRIPSASGSREVVVVPLARDAELRYHDWVAANRRLVEQRSGGRVGYVHLPNMGGEGLNEFARTYYPQTRKQALIVDVRWNGGGFVSEMILERLRRQVVGMVATRNAGESTYPDAVLNGPKICLINQWSASDGDLFPHFFRRFGLGKLLGMRTWGGVVGIRGGQNLVDGGYVYLPEFAYYDMNSTWMIENHGVEPDIELDDPPAEVLAGRDRQLEQAIERMVQAIDENPPRLPPRPADPTGR